MVNWKEDQRQKSEENVMLNRCRAAMHCDYIKTIKYKQTIIQTAIRLAIEYINCLHPLRID